MKPLVYRALVIADLLDRGWRPPPMLSDRKRAERLTESVERTNQYGQSLDLSAREIQVLDHLADGLSRQEVADEMGTSIETVKTQLKSATAKLGARNTTHAVALAVRAGLVQPAEQGDG